MKMSSTGRESRGTITASARLRPEAEYQRIIVLRAMGKHFSSGAEIRGFLEASPEHVSRLAQSIAAPAALCEGGHRRGPRVLSRSWFRAVARVRFSPGLGDLPLRTPRA